MSDFDWHWRENNWSSTCRCDICGAMRQAVRKKRWTEEAFKSLGPMGKEKFRRMYMAEMLKWDVYKPGGKNG